MDDHNDQLLAAPSDAAPPASAVPPPPPTTTNESGPARLVRPATQADGEFMAEILRNSETKIEIPPAAWPKIAAARGLTVDSAKTRWGQIKRKLGLNTTAKRLPEPAQKVRKAAGGASGKGKAAGKSSLATKLAAVGAAEDLGNLQDDTDRSEDEAGPSPAKKLKREAAVKEEDEDEKKPVAVKEEEAEELKKEEDEEKKPLVKIEED
ncbi:hypothetical protein DL771_005799 [Monosporascus sp. 5C6A]|nr:hypothetical protein DL771_005799 [Monosporascus sp. 5C6A]